MGDLSLTNCFAHCPECKYWVPAKFIHYDDESNTRVCSACLHEAGLLNQPGFTRRPFNYDPEPGSRRVQRGGGFTWKIINGVPTRVQLTD